MNNNTNNTSQRKVYTLPYIITKALVYIIGIVLCIGIGMWIYRYFMVERPRHDYAAKVENIKTMVRHNALQITDEAVYADTIDGVCEVYSIKARITVQYDLERMRYTMAGDTLVVELPREEIEAHELERHLLDEYFADGKLHFKAPGITGAQSKELEYRMKQYVTTKMINSEHIRRARSNELRNMVQLLRSIQGNVRVVLNIDHPDQEIHPDSISLPLDQ